MMSPIDAQITFCYTRDLPRTARFYEEVVGLRLVLDQGGCRIYRTAAGAYLGFCGRDDADRPAGVILTLVTDGVDAWHARLSERGVALVMTDEATRFVVKKGCKELDFGARPLRRAIENMIEDPLSEELLKGEFQGKDTITVGVKEIGGKKQLVFEGSATEPAEDAAAVGAGAADSSAGETSSGSE